MSLTPERDDAPEGENMCSILNVIIDHSMEDPTPMEPKEFNSVLKKKSSVKVPVVRVFGPLLRDTKIGPLQSACLHIHGVYPYMLARPVLAGPDGSLRRARPKAGYLNWDDASAVQQITDSVASTLEASIKSFDLERQQKKADNATANFETVVEDEVPVIRSVSVVEGRGFFTYCPGPPAPFLRIEYYNPKLRWKVKMMLERGLEISAAFHPDPSQYDRPTDDGQLAPGNDTDVLKMNCYEAHIPYTMQFFKDWNLAGMSYIHVKSGKIRACQDTCFAKYRAEPFDPVHDGRAVFIRSNTPPTLLWQGTIASGHSDDFEPPKKSTSVDVEIDCVVQDIRNIESVLKTMPSDAEERDKIQWRAVPSLQEIWRQERRRMTKLLHPEHDFLTYPPNTTTVSGRDIPSKFTLNAKEGDERSGALLAAKGMKSLVDVSEGLRDDFERVLKQILHRNDQRVKEVDHQLELQKTSPKELKTPSSKSRTENESMTPNWVDAIDALESLGQPAKGSSPTLDAALHALGSLRKPSHIPRTPERESSLDIEMADAAQDFDMEDLGMAKNERFSYPSSQGLHDSEPLTLVEPEIYIDRIERGDSILEDSNRDVEDYIDPETLVPYEILDFDEEKCRVKFTVENDPPNTVRVCGNRSSNCRRHVHNSDPEQRAKPGYYKTVTTGTFVDGLVDTSRTEYEEDEQDSNKFELALSILASQYPDQGNSGESHHFARPDLDTESIEFSHAVHPAERRVRPPVDSSSGDSEDDSDGDDHMELPQHISKGEVNSVAEKESRSMRDCPLWVTPVSLPPTRHASNQRNSLLPMESRANRTPWLRHISWHRESSEQYRPKFSGESILQPIITPPTRRKVENWWTKRKPESTKAPKRRKTESLKSDNIQCKPTNNTLQIDDNSRKLVASTSRRQHVFGAPLTENDVEEVQWLESQQWQLTMSQKSQNELEKQDRCGEASVNHREKQQGSQDLQTTNSSIESAISPDPKASRTESQTTSQTSEDALEGIGNQGGRLHIKGGGTLKAKTRATQKDTVATIEKSGGPPGRQDEHISYSCPMSFMAIEIHVQCRIGSSRLDSKRISMAPDPNKDKVFAIVYVYGIDPGGGESLRVLERCCLFVHFERETKDRRLLAKEVVSSMPKSNMGMRAPLKVECFDNESSLLLRLSSLVRTKDPDMLLSWDTQGAGLGFIIERGMALGLDKTSGQSSPIDMVRLLGRTPMRKSDTFFLGQAAKASTDAMDIAGQAAQESEQRRWTGSGLGSDWDERVGAGAAASSISGRLVFAGWKIVAEEVKHPNYSYLPAVTAAVLNTRIPHHDDLTLTQWYSTESNRWRVLHHRLNQAIATLLLFDALDIVGRAGEAARLSGVEFSQSFPGIRGSQYKVEGVLLRALQSLRSDERGSKTGRKKPVPPDLEYKTTSDTALDDQDPDLSLKAPPSLTNSPWKLRRGINETSELGNRHYFFFSPSLEDTNKQEALEVQAMTLEPQSGHYREPVVVCDFTALYPSLVIAYNLCYSTCAGKLEYQSTRREMRTDGKTTGRLGPFVYPERRTATVISHHLKSLRRKEKDESESDRAYVAPTGTIFVSEDVLKGVLPQVLDEILTTRAMLKRAAKQYKKHVKNLSPAILRQLEARQLALKYVANVTYGYTSATFSGRCAMPLLADTIVECGRKTLRKAIDTANSWGKGEKWKGAKVIYGDTDSLFVKLPGRSYIEAFEFGEELCRAVTADNPPPVQLKLEKVYLGSIMQTMKRYCGMKFDSKDQRKPVFEAKGLETVRRDQCALTQKVLRNSLITLFRHGIEAVREYLCRQWALIESGQIPVADFILTGRVRSKYRGGKEGPVQAVLAKRIGEADPGRILRHKERIPYVIVATPGITFRLKDCVLTPLELLERWDAYTVHTAYYIERHVNASLQRCLGLAPHFADVASWYRASPTPRRRIHFWPVRSRNRAMITTYFGSDVCSLCHKKCQARGRARVVVCEDCRNNQVSSSLLALSRLRAIESSAKEVASACSLCNHCFEDQDTFASVRPNSETNGNRITFLGNDPGDESLQIPLANCVCIDCPNTFKRHRLREQLIEASSTCDVLKLLD